LRQGFPSIASTAELLLAQLESEAETDAAETDAEPDAETANHRRVRSAARMAAGAPGSPSAAAAHLELALEELEGLHIASAVALPAADPGSGGRQDGDACSLEASPKPSAQHDEAKAEFSPLQAMLRRRNERFASPAAAAPGTIRPAASLQDPAARAAILRRARAARAAAVAASISHQHAVDGLPPPPPMGRRAGTARERTEGLAASGAADLQETAARAADLLLWSPYGGGAWELGSMGQAEPDLVSVTAVDCSPRPRQRAMQQLGLVEHL
jgi:hypothetical protein